MGKYNAKSVVLQKETTKSFNKIDYKQEQKDTFLSIPNQNMPNNTSHIFRSQAKQTDKSQ